MVMMHRGSGLGLIASAYTDPTPDILKTTNPNLLLWYSFEDVVGSNVPDKSSNGNDGTLTATTEITGVSGNARKFNNPFTLPAVPTDYITIGTPLSSTTYTLSWWTWGDGEVSGNTIFGNDSDDGVRWNASAVLVRNGGVNNSIPTTNPVVGWHHHLVTINGTAVEWFVDNVSVGTVTMTSGTAIPLKYIGASSTGSGTSSRVGIDEIRVYDKVVSTEERDFIYAEFTAPPFNPSQPSSITVSTIDATGNANWAIDMSESRVFWTRANLLPRQYKILDDSLVDSTLGNLATSGVSVMSAGGGSIYLADSDPAYSLSLSNGGEMVSFTGPGAGLVVDKLDYDLSGYIYALVLRPGSHGFRRSLNGTSDSWTDLLTQDAADSVGMGIGPSGECVVRRADNIDVGGSLGAVSTSTTLTALALSSPTTYFRRGSFIVIAGSEGSNGKMAYSTNAGTSWSTYTSAYSAPIRFAGNKYNDNVWWVEDNTRVFYSSDRLVTKVNKGSILSEAPNGDENSICMAGDNGAYISTTGKVYLIQTLSN